MNINLLFRVSSWGPDYDHSEENGLPTNAPPIIKGVVKMLVPKVDAVNAAAASNVCNQPGDNGKCNPAAP